MMGSIRQNAIRQKEKDTFFMGGTIEDAVKSASGSDFETTELLSSGGNHDIRVSDRAIRLRPTRKVKSQHERLARVHAIRDDL